MAMTNAELTTMTMTIASPVGAVPGRFRLNDTSGAGRPSSANWTGPPPFACGAAADVDYVDYYDSNCNPIVNDATIVFLFWLWKVAAPTLFALLAVFGTVGNLLVVHVVVSRPEMRSVTNLMLVSLALSDMTFLVVCVPLTAYKYAADSWSIGQWTCRLVNYLLYLTTYVNVYTLVAISVVRFASVVYPVVTRRLRTRRNAVVVSIGVWVVAAVGTSPTLPVFGVRTIRAFSFCGMSEEYASSLIYVFFVVGYVLPLTTIAFLNISIVGFLAWTRHKQLTMPSSFQTSSVATTTTSGLLSAPGGGGGGSKPGSCGDVRSSTSSVAAGTTTKGESAAARRARRHLRTARVVVPLVVVFGLSWLPLQVQSIALLHVNAPSGNWCVCSTRNNSLYFRFVTIVFAVGRNYFSRTV